MQETKWHLEKLEALINADIEVPQRGSGNTNLGEVKSWKSSESFSDWCQFDVFVMTETDRTGFLTI